MQPCTPCTAPRHQIRVLIYNGDADYILSHAGNEAWITKGLNISATSPWTKWRGSDGQVAGYFETFATGNPAQNFTFLTVKGAGHMVPKDRPRHALDMLARFRLASIHLTTIERATTSRWTRYLRFLPV